MTQPEPWLRGALEGVDPLIAPVLFSFQQAREDLARWTAGLSEAQVWARPQGLASVGFQLRHIAGSVDRLTTYLEGRDLSAAQLDELANEMEPRGSREELLAAVEASLRQAEEVVRGVEPASFREARTVGRLRLPTTVIGLLVHIAEHTQGHIGQAIVTAKLVISFPA
jgi:hypothetical protein